MKDKLIAVTILLLMTLTLLPMSAVGSEKSKAKLRSNKEAAVAHGATPSATATPAWDITKPSSCTVEGPPPCEKCTITCPGGHAPICIPGDNSGNVCVKPTSCTCKK